MKRSHQSLRSIEVLSELCNVFFRTKYRNIPWILDRELNTPLRSRNSIADVVLLGDFLRQICQGRSWPAREFRIWTLCCASRRVCTDLLGFRENEIGVISRYQLVPQAARQRALPKIGSPWTLVYSGRLSMTKNFHYFLQFASALQMKWGPKMKIVCFGSVHSTAPDHYWQENHFDFLRETLPWHRPPIMVGEVGWDEWPKKKLETPVLAALSTSVNEDFGMSVAQAQALGWPCILSKWGAHQDVIGTNLIKVPVKLLGQSGDEVSAVSRKAEAAAKLIYSRNRFSPDIVKLKTDENLFPPPVPVSKARMSEILNELRTKYSRSLFLGARTNFRSFSKSDRGKIFFDRYRKIFAGLQNEK